MFQKQVGLLLIGVFYLVHCRVKIKTTRFEIKKHLELVDLNVTYVDAPDFFSTSLTYSIDVFRELKELMIQLSVMMPRSDPNSLNFDSPFFSTRFNFCTFSERKISSIVAKAFLQDVQRKSTFKWVCPLKKGRYQIKNFTVAVPPVSFAPTTNGQVTTIFSARIETSKKFQIVATTIAEGRIWS